jgi:hypothetical protein
VTYQTERHRALNRELLHVSQQSRILSNGVVDQNSLPAGAQTLLAYVNGVCSIRQVACLLVKENLSTVEAMIHALDCVIASMPLTVHGLNASILYQTRVHGNLSVMTPA